MQEKYFLKLKTGLLSENVIANNFAMCVKYLDIDKLRKIPQLEKFKKYLLQYSLSDIFNMIAIRCAQRDNLKALQFLVEDCGLTELIRYSDKLKITLLHEACLYGSKEVINYLLQKGSDINAVDHIGAAPLHRLVQLEARSEHIPLLKNFGANLNIRDQDGLTPLHMAAFYQNMTAIRELKNCGANMKAKHDDMDYLQIIKKVSLGNITVKSTPSLLPIENDEDSREKSYAKFIFSFFTEYPNQQLFQECITDLLTRKLRISSDDAFILIDSYFIASSTSPETLIKFCKKHISTNKINKIDVVYMVLRISHFLIHEQQVKSLEQLADFILKLLLEEAPSVDSSKLFNEVVLMSNLCGLYEKAEKVGLIALQHISDKIDKRDKGYLYYNIGLSFGSRLYTKEANDYYKNAFDLINDENDILFTYTDNLMSLGNFQEAKNVCAISKCGEFAELMLFHISYRLSELNAKEILSLLPNEYADKLSQNFSLVFKSVCYKELGYYDKAVDHINLLFSRYTSEPLKLNGLQNIAWAAVHRLKILFECGRHNESLQFMLECKAQYPAIFERDLRLRCFSVIVYLANKLTNEAEIVINGLQFCNFSQETLSQLYTQLAVSELKSSEIIPEHTMHFLDLAIKIDPNNYSAVYYKALVHVLNKDENQYIAIQKELDNDLIRNIAIENSLVRDEFPEEEEVKFEDYDPVKIHQYFQATKHQSLNNLCNNIIDTSDSIAKWLVDGKHYSESDANLVKLDSRFYPNYFAVIDFKQKIDTEMLNRFQLALNKGLCKRKFEANGIKFLKGNLIELKIDDDARLYTSKVYRNPTSHFLVVFDNLGNHKSIEALLKKRKSIVIVDVGIPTVTAQSNEYTKKFFKLSNTVASPIQDKDHTQPSTSPSFRG